MIREWLTYLRTRSRPEAHQLGYVHEAIAIRERHARHRDAWEPHLRRSQEFILDAAEKCSDLDHCIVFGSGLLLDVPIEALAVKFTEVSLVDIVHLPEITRQVSQFDNVNLVESDVTGLISQCVNLSDSKRPPSPSPPTGLFPKKADLVVSLNLLSQLPLNLVDTVTDYHMEAWAKEIQQSHWQWLPSVCSKTLIEANHRWRRE